MPDTTALLSQVYLKLDGNEAPEELMTNLQELSVENSLHLPDVATLTLGDPRGQWVDDERLGPGRVLTVEAKLTQDQARRTVFEGEIVELEPEYMPGKRRLVLRAFDRLHRLGRGRQVRSFQNVTDGDLIQRIGQELNLDVQVGPTSQVHAYVLQDNQTNLEFLRDRAASLGYMLFVRGKTLHCDAPTTDTTVELKWGETLGEFHPRMTTVGQLDSATVRGWDPVNRQEIVGQAKNGRGAPRRDGDTRGGGEVAHSAFNQPAETLVTDRAIRTQAEADKLAQAVMDRAAGRFIEAEGTASGNPAIVAGVSITVKGLGKRFDGTYFVTGAAHTYSHDEGYSTRFSVSGHRPSTLLGLLQPETGGGGQDGRINGLVIGIVTDNADPDGRARVKVKYPSLSGEHASDWARIAMPGAGPDRGLELIPEVNDEVLVGFEHGDVHHPYILGGLWNGKDAPPRKSDQVVSSGKVQQRIIRSRLGHTITLDDSDDKPSITIVDKTGDNTIKIDSSNNNLTASVKGDIVLEAGGNVTVKGQSVQIEAQSDFKAKGSSATVEASGALSLKGGTAELEGSTSTTVKGGTVSIN